ncbi:Hypothetical protein SCF082_LOCUS36021 [Durusdinium trenchii]|uniref:Ubiquitin-like domain-containing protein n=1 Tax=Durusdinium trenchii TaxID=1381693 RepID=A0ABP0PDQ4_9DINO
MDGLSEYALDGDETPCHHDRLCVLVKWLSGKQVEIQIDGTALVQDLKVALEIEGIPAPFQMLIWGTDTELGDQDRLDQLCDSQGILQLVLLISSTRSLGANAGKTRKLATLREVACHRWSRDFIRHAIPEVAFCLEDPVDEVREAAVEALMALTDLCPTETLAEVRRRLAHPDWGVRHNAVKALQQISSPDDSQSIDSLKMLMKDSSCRVRVAVFLALMRLLKLKSSAKCDDPILNELKESLKDSHFLIKVAGPAGCGMEAGDLLAGNNARRFMQPG